MKKGFKWAGIVTMIPVMLFFILVFLFYFPPFQNWAVKQVALYASKQMNLKVTVDHINLEFPLNLGVEGVKVIQQNDSLPQVKDTVADIRKTVANIRLWPLFKKQVEIDQLKFYDMKVNTTNFIHKARIKGAIGHLSVESHGIDLGKQFMKIDKILLVDANVNVELSDTVPPDTSKTKNFWKIAVGHINVKNTKATIHMPGDTLCVQAYAGKIAVNDGFFDLFKGLYVVKRLDWADGQLKYDNRFKTRTKGLDANHLEISHLFLGVDSLSYCDPKLDLKLRQCSFKEKSGIIVTQLTGPISLASTRVYLPHLTFKTPTSSLMADINMDLNAFDDLHPGKMDIALHGSFGKQDLMRFMGDMPLKFRQNWPNYPLMINGVVRGNLQKAHFAGFLIKLPTAFNIKLNGFMANLTNRNRLMANVSVKAHTYNLNFVTALLDKSIKKTIHVPNGIAFDGNVKVNGQRYASNFVISEGGGTVGGDVQFDARRMVYNVRVKANKLPIQHFVIQKGLHPFTGYVEAHGAGTDFMSSKTKLTAKARIVNFNYSGYDLSGMKADATVQDGRMHALVDSRNRLLNGSLSFDGLLRSKRLCATISGDIKKADLYRLGLTDEAFATGMCGHVDICTDLKDDYEVQGFLSDVVIENRGKAYRPEDAMLDIVTRRDTTHVKVDCGDFHLDMDARGDYRRLMKQAQGLTAEIQRQIKNKTIEQISLRRKLPLAKIMLTSGKNNTVAKILNYYGYHLKSMDCNLTSSPVGGLNGSLHIDSLVMDSVRLDTINLTIFSDSVSAKYKGQIRNNEGNPQYVFNLIFNGAIEENGTNLTARLYDANNKLGVGLGVEATMEKNGLRFHSYGADPVLGYKTFHINNDNYVFLGDDRRVSAKVDLKADDGMWVQIHSNDDDAEALQDLTVSLHQFDLEKVLAVLPYAPDVSGVLNGDYHLLQTEDGLSVSTNMSVDNLIYQKCPMGNVSTEFVYMPKSDGSHYVDGILMNEGQEVATVKGTYKSEGGGNLDATLGMKHLPLSMMNGFIPNQIIGLKGYGEGNLSIKGHLSKPDINGEVYLDSAYLVSVPYGVQLRFDNDPVTITNSHLLFENFEMYAHNDSPLNVSGYYDFSDLNKMMINLRIRAKNFELINAKETSRSVAYGKAFVNFFGTMTGPVDNLKLRGKLDVLGTTDMSYVLRDSPLTTDNQLNDLVKFTDFRDSTETVINRPPLTGFNMDLTMDISKGAHIMAYLNADQSNYIDLLGGGTLRMQYNPVDNLRLVGKYTLSNGEMKYSLPVIPLKTFTIQDGSCLEFTGDPMNPTLDISASEMTKATVSNEGGVGRSVSFVCGVNITKTLNNMGLEFTLDAPEDMAIHSELESMGKEQRGKLAVSMLTTGMYLANGNTSTFSMNSALSNFLSSEINNITGNALRTLDLSFGMDNATDASGNGHTDYSFKFAKRFWNNRVKIAIGGKISTGSDVYTANQSFFDNVSLEYRLDDTANKYVNLFYENNSYDWLDGYTQKFGGGFIWRRTLQHFRDIFKFNSDGQVMPVPNDSLIQKMDGK